LQRPPLRNAILEISLTSAEAAPADARKTAVRILRFDAAAASADASVCLLKKFSEVFFLDD